MGVTGDLNSGYFGRRVKTDLSVAKKEWKNGVPMVAQWKRTRLASMASPRGLRTRRCRELWLQTRLGSGVAVAVA